jgi:hypothetical protein
MDKFSFNVSKFVCQELVQKNSTSFESNVNEGDDILVNFYMKK